eukprot:3435383-Prorocentrum_lima.AAC.1
MTSSLVGSEMCIRDSHGEGQLKEHVTGKEHGRAMMWRIENEQALVVGLHDAVRRPPHHTAP